jgi:hypothetical protein
MGRLTGLPGELISWLERHGLQDAGASAEKAAAVLGEPPDRAPVAFATYLASFCGIDLPILSGPGLVEDRLTLRRPGHGVRRVAIDGEDCLMIGGYEQGPLAICLSSDGSVFYFDGRRRGLPVAGSIGAFLAKVERTNRVVGDGRLCSAGTNLSSRFHAHRLAEDLGLLRDEPYSDRFVAWYVGDRGGLAIRPRGDTYSPSKHRTVLTLFWGKGDPEFPREALGRLRPILEPHLFAILEDYLGLTVPNPPESRKAVLSYRWFSDAALRKLPVPPPPGPLDERFRDYLHGLLRAPDADLGDDVRYYVAAGLVAFGEKEMLRELFRFRPDSSDFSWPRPAWALQFLDWLVSGMRLCPYDDLDAWYRWLEDNIENLRWHEEFMFYVYKMRSSR